MFDVVIVGAGPAGSTAAKLLTEAGRNVCLIDRDKFPRKKSCAAWVSVKTFEMFEYLDEIEDKLIELPFAGLTFHSPDLSESGTFTERGPSGYLTSRSRFDHVLLRLARTAGAKIKLGVAVTKIEANEESVTVHLDDDTSVEASVLIGADGSTSLVAHQMGLHSTFPTGHGILCVSEEMNYSAKKVEAFFDKDHGIHIMLAYRDHPGYGWVFPKRNSVHVGLGIRQDNPAKAEAMFDDFITDLKKAEILPPELNPKEPVQWLNPAGAALDFEGHVGKRTILIGDAGGFVTAGSGEGIFPAMWSARIAADVIHHSLDMEKIMDGLLAFKREWRPLMADYLRIPNSNLTFLLPLIFSNQQMTDKFARAYLYGENI